MAKPNGTPDLPNLPRFIFDWPQSTPLLEEDLERLERKRQISCYNQSRTKITGDFIRAKILEEDAINQLLMIRALHPQWLTGCPRQCEDRSGYDQWINSLLKSRICYLFSPFGCYGIRRTQFINTHKAIAARGGRSATGASLENGNHAFHHVVPFSKTIGPTYALLESPTHPELDLCELLLKSEHAYHHGFLNYLFGGGVYPTPVNWYKLFKDWVTWFKQNPPPPFNKGKNQLTLKQKREWYATAPEFPRSVDI